MAKKRLNIEIEIEQYELLRKRASAGGTTVSGVIRELIDDIRNSLAKKAVKDYRSDSWYKRRGSFDGPSNLSENHDQHLYGKSSR